MVKDDYCYFKSVNYLISVNYKAMFGGVIILFTFNFGKK